MINAPYKDDAGASKQHCTCEGRTSSSAKDQSECSQHSQGHAEDYVVIKCKNRSSLDLIKRHFDFIKELEEQNKNVPEECYRCLKQLLRANQKACLESPPSPTFTETREDKDSSLPKKSASSIQSPTQRLNSIGGKDCDEAPTESSQISHSIFKRIDSSTQTSARSPVNNDNSLKPSTSDLGNFFSTVVLNEICHTPKDDLGKQTGVLNAGIGKEYCNVCKFLKGQKLTDQNKAKKSSEKKLQSQEKRVENGRHQDEPKESCTNVLYECYTNLSDVTELVPDKTVSNEDEQRDGVLVRRKKSKPTSNEAQRRQQNFDNIDLQQDLIDYVVSDTQINDCSTQEIRTTPSPKHLNPDMDRTHIFYCTCNLDHDDENVDCARGNYASVQRKPTSDASQEERISETKNRQVSDRRVNLSSTAIAICVTCGGEFTEDKLNSDFSQRRSKQTRDNIDSTSSNTTRRSILNQRGYESGKSKVSQEMPRYHACTCTSDLTEKEEKYMGNKKCDRTKPNVSLSDRGLVQDICNICGGEISDEDVSEDAAEGSIIKMKSDVDMNEAIMEKRVEVWGENVPPEFIIIGTKYAERHESCCVNNVADGNAKYTCPKSRQKSYEKVKSLKSDHSYECVIIEEESETKPYLILSCNRINDDTTPYVYERTGSSRSRELENAVKHQRENHEPVCNPRYSKEASSNNRQTETSAELNVKTDAREAQTCRCQTVQQNQVTSKPSSNSGACYRCDVIEANNNVYEVQFKNTFNTKKSSLYESLDKQMRVYMDVDYDQESTASNESLMDSQELCNENIKSVKKNSSSKELNFKKAAISCQLAGSPKLSRSGNQSLTSGSMRRPGGSFKDKRKEGTPCANDNETKKRSTPIILKIKTSCNQKQTQTHIDLPKSVDDEFIHDHSKTNSGSRSKLQALESQKNKDSKGVQVDLTEKPDENLVSDVKFRTGQKSHKNCKEKKNLEPNYHSHRPDPTHRLENIYGSDQNQGPDQSREIEQTYQSHINRPDPADKIEKPHEPESNCRPDENCVSEQMRGLEHTYKRPSLENQRPDQNHQLEQTFEQEQDNTPKQTQDLKQIYIPDDQYKPEQPPEMEQSKSDMLPTVGVEQRDDRIMANDEPNHLPSVGFSPVPPDEQSKDPDRDNHTRICDKLTSEKRSTEDDVENPAPLENNSANDKQTQTSISIRKKICKDPETLKGEDNPRE